MNPRVIHRTGFAFLLGSVVPSVEGMDITPYLSLAEHLTQLATALVTLTVITHSNRRK